MQDRKKKSLKGAVILIMVMCMAIGSAISAYAAYSEAERIISIKYNYEKTYISAERSGRYSWVYVKNYKVYPKGNQQDNYQYIWAGLDNGSGTMLINADVKLKEGDPATKLTIKEGYLNILNIRYYFYGNSINPAQASIGYTSY